MDLYYTRYDGNNKEGIGSILQSQLHLYAYCRMNNYKMFFPGFQNISHYQYSNETKDVFNKKLNDFLNIPSDGINATKYIDPIFLLKNWGEKYNSEKKNYISELFNLISYNKDYYFDKTKNTVSIHIRNLNSQDVCFDKNRELYSDIKKKYFINLIKNIYLKHGNDLDIHIFSQGLEKDFIELKNNFDVKLHLNDDLIITFYHLITSDILITSNSSLSWTAHLYNKNKFVYSRNNFFHSWYPSTFFVDFDGNMI
jgi:hypothetical protein